MSEKLQIQLDVNNELQTKAFRWAMALCEYSKMDNVFLADFWNRLVNDKGIYEEFVYYLEHGDFLCKEEILGVSLPDLMIWQLDRFKSELDRDKSDLKGNGDKMILMAFDTMLKMRKEPEKYKEFLEKDTGTDYLGKY